MNLCEFSERLLFDVASNTFKNCILTHFDYVTFFTLLAYFSHYDLSSVLKFVLSLTILSILPHINVFRLSLTLN